MGGSKADYFQYCNYKNEIDAFAQIIIDSNGRKHVADIEYISNGAWNARKNGVNIKNINIIYNERIEGDKLIIEVNNPKTEWREWIKTLGDIHKEDSNFIIQAQELSTPFVLIPKSSGYEIQLPLEATKISPIFGKYFRQVFRKTAYCVACRACEANCTNNSVSFIKNANRRWENEKY
jgi:phosphoadenosine phosphosulfate reductase